MLLFFITLSWPHESWSHCKMISWQLTWWWQLVWWELILWHRVSIRPWWDVSCIMMFLLRECKLNTEEDAIQPGFEPQDLLNTRQTLILAHKNFLLYNMLLMTISDGIMTSIQKVLGSNPDWIPFFSSSIYFSLFKQKHHYSMSTYYCLQ